MTDARTFALAAHGAQMYGDKPYSVHLDAVANIVICNISNEWGQSDIYIAAWLHDVVEDTDIALTHIFCEFGPLVRDIVRLCTASARINDAYGRSQDIVNRIICTDDTHTRRGAAIVKVADRIANLEAAEPGDRHSLRYMEQRTMFGGLMQYVPHPLAVRYYNACARHTKGMKL